MIADLAVGEYFGTTLSHTETLVMIHALSSQSPDLPLPHGLAPSETMV